MAIPAALRPVLRKDRAITLAGLAALCLLAWVYLLSGAGMDQPAWRMIGPPFIEARSTMATPSMDMVGDITEGPSSSGLFGTWLLAFGMWASMMVAMMTPSATPAILLYARVARQAKAASGAAQVASPLVFALGYLLMWLAFSVAAAGLQVGLVQRGLISAGMLASHSRGLNATVLLLAGLYQFTPWRNLCLTQCRSPAGFLTAHWRAGLGGAVRLGALHGAYCVGCCWALMTLLFVGGVMNLIWIAALTLLLMVEKVVVRGAALGRLVGALLLVTAGLVLVLPAP